MNFSFILVTLNFNIYSICITFFREVIVEWDVRHGDGIQNVFIDDSRVMYVSLHRRDLFPYQGVEGDCKGNCSYVGEGEGVAGTL